MKTPLWWTFSDIYLKFPELIIYNNLTKTTTKKTLKIGIHCKTPDRPIEVKTQHCFHQNESMLNDCYQSISQSGIACLFIQSEPIECLELYSHKYQSPCCNVCSHVPNIDFARIFEHLSLLVWFASFAVKHDCCVGFLFCLAYTLGSG